MKSYKDIDKSIVMNAPEGAMWVHEAGTDLYYKVTTKGALVLVYDKELSKSAKADVTITLPENPNQQLIKNLEFLQILANNFPEIKDKVVGLMEVELDAWWHDKFEE